MRNGVETAFDCATSMKAGYIDKKRQQLGIDKAHERVLIDMAARREIDAALNQGSRVRGAKGSRLKNLNSTLKP